MHPLLHRQLRQHWGDPATVPEEWQPFMAAVDAAYRETDDDRVLREHALEAMLGELTQRNRSLQQEKAEQEKLIRKIEETRQQLVQSEKLASIGQLAAGVAHEINNPIGFVHSNLGSLTRYFGNLLGVMERFETCQPLVAGLGQAGADWLARTKESMTAADYTYLKEDIPVLLAESMDGVDRVRRIVQDLRDFSRADNDQKWERVDLRSGLDATLNILRNEIKYRADVVKEYGDMPPVECIPSQINQVFMNLMANAAQSMPEGRRGAITLRCGQTGGEVWVEVADDGAGISAENMKKIFDPFFTTKPVGKGTGLGLALSYGIVEKHGGRIEVKSQPGVGTTFRVILPLAQPTDQQDNPPSGTGIPSPTRADSADS